MNTRELYVAINNEFTTEGQREVLISLLNQLAQVSECVLRIAGERKRTTGEDVLTMRNWGLLRKFLELPEEEGER